MEKELFIFMRMKKPEHVINYNKTYSGKMIEVGHNVNVSKLDKIYS